MVVSLGPRPQQGRPSTVELIDTGGTAYPLQLVEDTYQVQEAQRFGDKVSVGPLTYQDFNPYESATVSANFQRGFGLRRYADWQGEGDAYGFILESSNIDTRHGIAILSDAVTVETLPNSTAPVVWVGDVLVSGLYVLVAVCGFAGRCVYTKSGPGVWQQAVGTTAAAPVAGAVGVFNGVLVLGYGTAAFAQYTTDGGATFNTVTDSAAASIFVFAYTNDRAAAYVAGGAVGRPNIGQAEVMAATDGHTFDLGSRVVCGGADVPITGLAPGGGLATLYVGKTTHLAEIDNNNVYRVLVPYNTRWPRNSQGMRWWMGRTGAVGEVGAEQTGPVVLVVPRDRQLMAYIPSSQNAGQAQNLTPWADPSLRPPSVRGETRAVLGTARWLYSAITNGTTGQSWVLCRDGHSSATSIYLDLGVNACQALGYSTLRTVNPALYIGTGNNIGVVTLPIDAEWPLDDTETRRTLQGWLKLPEIDLGFVAEQKVEFSVQVVADNLSANQSIQVQYATDGGAFTVLGTAQASPVSEMVFPDPRPTVHTLQLLLNVLTTDATQTPQLRAIVVRQSLNAKLYRMWVFQARVPAGAGAMSDDLLNPYATLQAFWNLRRAGVPIIFQDRWGDRAQVRMMEMAEQATKSDPDGPLETLVALRLLEVAGTATVTTTDTWALGAWATVWLSSPLLFNGLGPGFLAGSETWTNLTGTAAWPRVTFTGPGKRPQVTNVVTSFGGSPAAAQTWRLDKELLAGEVITANFDPAYHTVLDAGGRDQSAHVTLGSAWWSLASGSNAIAVSMDGATPASQIALTRPL